MGATFPERNQGLAAARAALMWSTLRRDDRQALPPCEIRTDAQGSKTMKLWLISALMLALVATTAPTTAEAKRLGAGRPAGMQRNMPARTAPDAVPAKPVAPQAAPAAAPATPAAPPAAAPKRNWMGPLAGIAAGLGIGALLSHFGMGGMMGGLGGILSTLLLLGGAALLVMFLVRRFGAGASRTPAMAGAGASGMNTQPAWPQAAQREPMLERQALEMSPDSSSSSPPSAASAPIPSIGSSTPVEPGITRAFVPAAFDSDGFTRTAKLIFIRLQAANDTADLDDLRRFTTPELYASIRLDIQERGDKPQSTDVVKVDAEVLDVVNEADRQIVSVRFHGQVVEEKGGAPAAFNEVWHLVKPHDDSQAWAIAGIEPLTAA
jgi:predicted lipid-binding transport protein (Tim44 family)